MTLDNFVESHPREGFSGRSVFIPTPAPPVPSRSPADFSSFSSPFLTDSPSFSSSYTPSSAASTSVDSIATSSTVTPHSKGFFGTDGDYEVHKGASNVAGEDLVNRNRENAVVDTPTRSPRQSRTIGRSGSTHLSMYPIKIQMLDGTALASIPDEPLPTRELNSTHPTHLNQSLPDAPTHALSTTHSEGTATPLPLVHSSGVLSSDAHAKARDGALTPTLPLYSSASLSVSALAKISHSDSISPLRPRPKPVLELKKCLAHAVSRRTKLPLKFCILVAGSGGLGKSTFIRMLFQNAARNVKHLCMDNVDIEIHDVYTREGDVSGRFTIIDTPQFGLKENNSKAWEPLIELIEAQYRRYMQQEEQPMRESIQDNRIHVCIYFLPPCAGLMPLDIKAMQELAARTNLIPVISQSDSCSAAELQHIKRTLRDAFGIYDIDLPAVARKDAPYALVCSTEYIAHGRRGRRYPWGSVDVDLHSDWAKLRDVLFAEHLLYLTDQIHNNFYPKYRLNSMSRRYRAAIGEPENPMLAKTNYVPDSGRSSIEVARIISGRTENQAVHKKLADQLNAMKAEYSKRTMEHLEKLKERETKLVDSKHRMDLELDDLRKQVRGLQVRLRAKRA